MKVVYAGPVIISLLFGTISSAQEWTRFRGPNGSGLTETTFPSVFGEKDYAWQVELPGVGHSSPVVWQDHVYLTCSDETGAERQVVCVSAKTGKIVWKKPFKSETFKKHTDNSYASCTPTVDEKRVYVCWNTPEEFTLMALTHDGELAWKANLGPVVSQHGSGNSPILVGNILILGDEQDGESFLFGLDRETGKVIWKTPRQAAKYAYSTPLVVKSGQVEAVVFTSQAEGMTGVDPKSGKILWQVPSLFDSRTVGSPATGDGIVVATCGEGPGGHVLQAVRPGNGTAEVVWKTRSEVPYVPTPLFKGGLLYYWSDRGMVTCVKAADGAKVWQQKVDGSFFCSPICAGNTIYNLTKKGEVVAIAADKTFNLLGRTMLPISEKTHATPAVSNGRMFIRTYSHLYCIKSSGGNT